MSSKNIFSQRERGLENEFFYKVDQQLLANLKEQMDREVARQALAVAGRIADDKLLDELVDLGVRPESLAAINLIPLVLIAWADSRMAEKERLTVLKAAHDEGVREGGPGYLLLEHWLKTPPEKSVRETWERYVLALSQALTRDACQTLGKNVMQRARAVAKASHGILGFGKISPEEAQMLDEFEALFCKSVDASAQGST